MENSHDGNVEEIVFLEEGHSIDEHEVIIEHEEEHVEPEEFAHRAPPHHDNCTPAWAAGLVAMVKQVQDELSIMKAAA